MSLGSLVEVNQAIKAWFTSTRDMSASPMARAATQGQDIPTRRVVITSEEDMPADSWLPNDLLLHKMANKSDRAQTTPPPLGEQSLGRRLEAQKSFTRGHFWWIWGTRHCQERRQQTCPAFQGWHQTWGKRSRSLRTTLRCPTRRGTRMGTTSSPWISDFHVIVLLPFLHQISCSTSLF